MERVDIVIIGAGVIGLAVAYSLSDRRRQIIVVEKNPSFGQETSSRNSEVIHSGIYYPKDSLKAITCIRGKDLLYELCSKHNIAFRKLGKFLIALDRIEEEKIKSIYENAINCGVDNLSFMDKKNFKKIEPNIKAETVIFSPDSGIIDSHSLMKFFFNSAKDKGADFIFSTEVKAIEKNNANFEIIVKEPDLSQFSFQAKYVVNCAGLWSDRVAELAGIDTKEFSYKIYYCKGQYFRISNPNKFNIDHLIYPPPTRVSLGIHITPDLGRGLRLGPDDKYIDDIDYEINHEDKTNFFESVRKFLPSLQLDDLIADTVGVRPKLQRSDEDFRDFIINEEKDKGLANFINCLGIESPGLTACLSIAERVKSFIR